MAELKINSTYIKVLETVYYLNKDSYYPLNEGIFKILTGKKDEESIKFSSLPTYGTLISVSSKRVCGLTLMLTRYNYLEKVYDSNSNDLYFKVTKLGYRAISEYHKNSTKKYVKTIVKDKATIVKL